MFERLESHIMLIISFLGTLATLITAVQRLLQVLLAESQETLADLKRDVVHLEQQVQAQQAEIEGLQTPEPEPEPPPVASTIPI